MTSDPSRLWRDLVTVALLGTERQPPALPPRGTPLGDLLARLEGADPERALLGAAAALSLYQRAGRLPVAEARPEPAPCAPDERPRCTARAGQHLALMLSGEHPEVLPEWLAAAAAAGRRAPEEALPELLELGRRQPDLREAILPVLGARGAWLAAQNPDWDYVTSGDDEAVWQTGSRTARRALLQRLRAREPDRARELLASTWGEETPEDRAAFLALFRTGLSMVDEPFLEEALDDRRKEVRRAAAELLARLPASRLCRRMEARVGPLLALTRLLFGRGIEVKLPETCDPAMLRDGIEPQPQPTGKPLGEKAGWLLQMLGAVPPALWCERWGASPADLVQAVGKSEWRTALLTGWAAAAARHGDAGWAEALLRVPDVRDTPDGPALAAALPAVRREALATEIVRSGEARREGKQGRREESRLLEWCRHPWSVPFSRTMLESLRRDPPRGDQPSDYELCSLLKQFGRYVHPSLAREALSGWPKQESGWPNWERAVAEFLALLQFRNDMLEEIKQ